LIHIKASNKNIYFNDNILSHFGLLRNKKNALYQYFFINRLHIFSPSADLGTQIIRKGFSARKNKNAESRL